MAASQRVLVVEDEDAIRDAVAAYLEREGFWVTPVADGLAAVEAFERHSFDLVVLDLMLPKLPGEEVCRRIRDTSDVPIIMLTAKGEEAERIAGLEMGADDYLVKPFSPRELVARVRALLRRARVEEEPQRGHVVFGPLAIDLAGHRVFLGGEEVDLTASEYKLLVTLSRYPGRVYSRMELVEKVLGYDFEGYERAIDSHVKNLRAKLGDDPKEPRYIHTVFGVGYRFQAADEAEETAGGEGSPRAAQAGEAAGGGAKKAGA
ncbi:MAG: response regulator transcription factor [Coriobacteriia bacterium]|nr:response regulator transcription factor [Coriobacteriia bacterium]